MEIHVHFSRLCNWKADADGMARNTIVHYRSVHKTKDKTRHMTIYITQLPKNTQKEYQTATFDVFSGGYTLRMIMLTNIFTWKAEISSEASSLIAVYSILVPFSCATNAILPKPVPEMSKPLKRVTEPFKLGLYEVNFGHLQGSAVIKLLFLYFFSD